MKAARLLFGASAVFFGVLCLLWHDPATWQNLHHLWSLPFGAAIGAAFMAAQIAGGIGIQLPRTVRPAALLLAIVYLGFSLACVPDIVAAANTYDKYGGSFFIFLSLFFAALAVFAVTEPRAQTAARDDSVLQGHDFSRAANSAATHGALAPEGNVSRAFSRPRVLFLARLARVGLGVCAISFTLGQGLILRDTARAVPPWIPPSPMFWAILTTAAFALAALAILANRYARLAMRLMALMVGLFAILVWMPHLIAAPHRHFLWSELAETLLVAGAAWTIAGSSPPGRKPH